MKHFLSFLLLCCTLAAYAISFPVSKPGLGNPSVVVCHQNAYNYFVVDLTGDRQTYSNQSGLEDKTRKMVQSLRYIDADIYALCELEVNDSCLAYLTKAMNTDAGSTIYAYVKNNKQADNTVIMSGFIYRKDRVRPVGSAIEASTQTYYKRTMRVQLFEEIATGEKFYLSQNHFKAKDSTDDAGQSKRDKNAADLIAALSRLNADPDILITGDLNETTTEPAVTSLINAGYAEQLERFNTNPYSYYYSGRNQLIDHALANASMAAQVTGAGVFHINTATRTNQKSTYWYSDHDPILVGLRLGASVDPDCEGLHDEQKFTDGFGDFEPITTLGTAAWESDASYGAKISAYNKADGEYEAWIVSPEYDLTGLTNASVTIDHNIYYNNAGDTLYCRYQTLCYTTDYTGDPATTSWVPVRIPQYAVKKYVSAVCNLPAEAISSSFRYALHYQAPSPAEGNYWEVKSVKLDAFCQSTSALGEQPSFSEEPAARKVFYDGHLYIVRDDVVYTISGQRL